MSPSNQDAIRSTFVTSDLIADGKLVIGDGYRAKNSELAADGLPFARAGNIDGEFHFDDADRFPEKDLAKVGDKISRPGDVVFTSKGTVGRMAWVRASTPRFVYAPQLCFWRSLDDSVVDPRWLYYWMHGDEFRPQMLGVKGQTDMADYVSLSDQRRMTITLPRIEDQRAIAAVLGSLDDKIEQNRRTARALERLARAIFRAWFVDFEPVKAKAAGAASFPSMPQAVFDTLPTTFTDSDLGPVPEGWEVKPIAEVCHILSGGTPKRSVPEFWDGDVPWYSVKDAPGEGEAWVYKTSETITSLGVAGSAAQIVPRGCTIISARGTVGKLALAGQPMAFNQSCYGLMPRDGRGFHCLFLMVQHIVADLQQHTHGSVFDTITKDTFGGVNVPVADVSWDQTLDSVVAPYFEMLLALALENEQLAQLRDYLLPQLLSGQVPVEVGDA